MSYFITGGTGFIGRRLIGRLALRGEPIHLLVRAASLARFERLRAECGQAAPLLVPVTGDLGSEGLGIAAGERQALRGKIRHFFHLGALYDLAAPAAPLERANLLGTRNALELAQEIEAGCFHHMSSIAVAGRYPGVFTEEMFEEAKGLEHPYFRTKHEAEALVRASRVPWRIYRPGMVVGDSRSGVMDKIDGPYYLFKLIQRVRDTLPRWVPLIGPQGGHINLVPVDFVAAGLDHLAHLPGEDHRCFHLTDPCDRRVVDVLNLFAEAAHAPTVSPWIEPAVLEALAASAKAASAAVRPLERMARDALAELRIPGPVIDLLEYPTVFDAGRGGELLARAGIRVPPLEIDTVGRALGAHPAVRFCAATTGPSQLLLDCLFPDENHLYEFLTSYVGAHGESEIAGAAVVVAAATRVPRWVAEAIGLVASLAISMSAFAVTFVGVGLAPGLAVAAMLMWCEGFAVTMWNIVTVSLRQRVVPAHLLGRVNSAYRMIGWCLIPLGALAGGLAAHGIGLRAPYAIGGSLCRVTLVAAPPALLRGLRRSPSPRDRLLPGRCPPAGTSCRGR